MLHTGGGVGVTDIREQQGLYTPTYLLRVTCRTGGARDPFENLAISLQCGFALTYTGNLMMWDGQRRTRELVVEASQKIWGSPPLGVPRWNEPILRGAMP
jgi:hypothetical protein